MRPVRSAGVYAARLRLYGNDGLEFSTHDIALLRTCLELGGFTELSVSPDEDFRRDVDSRFRVDDPQGLLHIPARLAVVIEAALFATKWGDQVTSLDLSVRQVW